MRGKHEKQPEMLPNPFPDYATNSTYPDRLRVCFKDGTTQIYDLRIQQPHPIVRRNLEIIRNMIVGYERKEER